MSGEIYEEIANNLEMEMKSRKPDLEYAGYDKWKTQIKVDDAVRKAYVCKMKVGNEDYQVSIQGMGGIGTGNNLKEVVKECMT